MRGWWVAVLLGMFAVTYSVRLIPFLLRDPSRLPALLKRVLAVVPAAALGALVVPDAFYAVPGEIGDAGGAHSGALIAAALGAGAVGVAVVLTRFGRGLITSVMAAICVAWLGIVLWL